LLKESITRKLIFDSLNSSVESDILLLFKEIQGEKLQQQQSDQQYMDSFASSIIVLNKLLRAEI